MCAWISSELRNLVRWWDFSVLFIFTLYTYINLIFVYFLLISLIFYQIRWNIFQRFDYKIRLHINDQKIVGIRFSWTYACAMINYVIWSSLRRGMCECRLWIPYSSNPRGSTRPRVSRRKNPYLSMNSGLMYVCMEQINAQSSSLRSLVAAESILQQPMQPVRDHPLFCVGFECVYVL